MYSKIKELGEQRIFELERNVSQRIIVKFDSLLREEQDKILKMVKSNNNREESFFIKKLAKELNISNEIKNALEEYPNIFSKDEISQLTLLLQEDYLNVLLKEFNGFKSAMDKLSEGKELLLKERELNIIEELNKNIPIKEIRERFDTTAKELTKIRYKYNLKKLKTKEVMVKRRKQIIKYIKLEAPLSQIRNITGCSNGTIDDLLKELGIDKITYVKNYKEKLKKGKNK